MGPGDYRQPTSNRTPSPRLALDAGDGVMDPLLRRAA